MGDKHAFLRPTPSAFGVSFDVDVDANVDTGILHSLTTIHDDSELQRHRRQLPVYSHRTAFLYLVEHHATTVVVGETGSGKTTQIPQYLHEAGWTAGSRTVVCTQPRRVAAVTVARRVAREMGEPSVGGKVGYSIRFEDVTTPGVTCIKFCTDGVLLREIMDDPLLERYSVVMVDEAHERTVTTDILLGLLKRIQGRRPELRIVISSATIHAETIAGFFDRASLRDVSTFTNHFDLKERPKYPETFKPALMTIEGRAHAVQVHYLQEPARDYVLTAVETVLSLHNEDLPGDILVFLTGQQECQRAASLVAEETEMESRKLAKSRHGPFIEERRRRQQLMPTVLYAGIPSAEQVNALQPCPRGYRKVVFATNIAETSVTIEGIVYVVDCMFSKRRFYDPASGLESLMVVPISKSRAAQRAGRAGRIRPGHAFRLCTEADFVGRLAEHELPEVQCVELTSAVLELKSLGISDVLQKFDWISPPSTQSIIKALETLHALGALDDNASLTIPVGMLMAQMPETVPQLARILVAGLESGCVEEVCTIVAMLGVQTIWQGSGDEDARAAFAVKEGDLVTFLNVWKAWDGAHKRRRSWAEANGIHHRAMLRAGDIREQLLRFLKRHRKVEKSMASRDPVIERVNDCIVRGLFANAARLESEAGSEKDGGMPHYTLVRATPGTKAGSLKLRPHPSSVLFRTRPPWVCYAYAEETDPGW